MHSKALMRVCIVLIFAGRSAAFGKAKGFTHAADGVRQIQRQLTYAVMGRITHSLIGLAHYSTVVINTVLRRSSSEGGW